LTGFIASPDDSPSGWRGFWSNSGDSTWRNAVETRFDEGQKGMPKQMDSEFPDFSVCDVTLPVEVSN
jgi:hypothetical protein